MAAPPAFSTYVALSQERQARSSELRRAAVFLAALMAVTLVSLLYLNLRTRVVMRGEDVRLMALANSQQVMANNELAYRIAWETAPQRIEEHARKLRLAPITKWEAVSVPGLADQLKMPGATGAALPISPSPKPAGSGGLSPEVLLAQIKSWLGLGLRTGSQGTATP